MPCFTYPCFIFFASLPLLFLALSLSPLLSLYFISFSVVSHEPGIAGNSVLDDCLRRLSLAFFEDSNPGIVGHSVSDRNLSYSITLISLSLPRLSLALFEDSDPGIIGHSVSDRNLSYSITLLSLSLPRLSLAFFEDSDPGIVGHSVSDRNLSYSMTLLSLSLPRSGKGSCIMHTSKNMQWKVGSRYIIPSTTI